MVSHKQLEEAINRHASASVDTRRLTRENHDDKRTHFMFH